MALGIGQNSSTLYISCTVHDLHAGFTPIPIACILWKYISIVLLRWQWTYVSAFAAYLLACCLGLALKVLLSNYLITHAHHRLRQLEDAQLVSEPVQRRHRIESMLLGPYDRYRSEVLSQDKLEQLAADKLEAKAKTS
eukprot:TRINITY_DN11614_c0_g1_i12.p2 TRINITY_DN11614_c0_g1~~TRINITY_DN11614_c0_g1_i12.p2  ORF type:complete len:138 (+),score=24.04 TRINITY_DN11614_c0_g1_i12:1285-1698(+)